MTRTEVEFDSGGDPVEYLQRHLAPERLTSP
jgi:hypothetical protein